MAGNDEAAAEGVEKLFEHGQRLHVQIVCWLVQQKHVGLVDQSTQEVEAAPFTAAEAADATPLHIAREEKPLHHLGSLHAAAVARLNQRSFLLDELDQDAASLSGRASAGRSNRGARFRPS